MLDESDAHPGAGFSKAARSSYGEGIDVVLVHPQGPRNVGSVARAMRNFGLFRLTIVGEIDHLQVEAREMSVHALDVLQGARKVQTLEEALLEATYVVATTSKPRDRVIAYHPRELAPEVLKGAAEGRVALLFGAEDHGLDGDAIRRAHATVSIPTHEECRALNLAQAVLLIGYEISVAAEGMERVDWSRSGRLMHGEMRLELQRALEQSLHLTGIAHEGNASACQASLERLLSIGPMQSRDARLLFALARRVERMSAKLEGQR